MSSANTRVTKESKCYCNHLGSCPSKSAKDGVAPPVQHAVSHCAAGSTNDVAKLVAHTVDSIRVHLRSHANDTDLAMYTGTSLALAMESCRSNSTPSSAQRPPVSMPTTTNLQRPPANSG